MKRQDSVAIEIPGKQFLSIEPDFLPQVGTVIQLHKQLYGGDATLMLEIIKQEWHLRGNSQNPTFDIRLRTRIVNQ